MSKIYTNENQILMPKMLEIYKPDNFDWMSYQITVKNVLTLHHILEVCNGGMTTLDNLALITKKAHRILNMLQSKDPLLYNEWNSLFKYINELQREPDNYSRSYSRKLKKYSQKVIYK